jgi:hypothetical protein
MGGVMSEGVWKDGRSKNICKQMLKMVHWLRVMLMKSKCK